MAVSHTNSTLDDFLNHSKEMVFIAEEGGGFVRMSRALERALDPDFIKKARSTGLGPLVYEDDRGAFDEAWRRLCAVPEPMDMEVRLRTSGGAFRVFQVSAQWSAERGEIYGSLHVESAARAVERLVLEAIRENLPIALWATDARGVFVYHEGKGLEASGIRPKQFLGLNLFDLQPVHSQGPMRAALAGEGSHASAEADGRFWESWTLPVRNERGEVTHIAGASLDVTEVKRAESELRAKLELIEKQHKVIRSLSTPIIQVWDRVLTLPVVGMFDSSRAAEVTESVLREVVEARALYAIIDLTGVEAMDTATASHLLSLVRAVGLLGAEGIITGIHPAIAQTMVALDVGMSAIKTLATLREGLEYCIRRMGREGSLRRA